MLQRVNLGLIAGLGAVIAFVSSLIFLLALSIVQPFELQMIPKRMWMHSVTIDWFLIAFGFFAFCAAAFWSFMQPTSKSVEPKPKLVQNSGQSLQVAHDMREDSARVWVLPCLTSPLDRRLEAEADPDAFLALIQRYKKGEEIDAKDFPNSFFLRGARVPQDIMMGDFIFVSDEVASVLYDFDMGQETLIPIDGIFRGRNRARLEKSYSILSMTNRKAVFLPDASLPAAISQVVKSIPIWQINTYDFPDKSIAVAESSLCGPDLWVDPAVPHYLFISDRLKEALDKQGIGRKMGIRLCRVVKED